MSYIVECYAPTIIINNLTGKPYVLEQKGEVVGYVTPAANYGGWEVTTDPFYFAEFPDLTAMITYLREVDGEDLTLATRECLQPI
jgi:hypothetical protein